MRLFTVWIDAEVPAGEKVAPTAHAVIAIRPDDGALLIAGSDDRLKWVPAEECHIVQRFMSGEEERWWQSLATHNHGIAATGQASP